MTKEDRVVWSNNVEYMLTVIGFAVGLGAVWRFPSLVYINGGAAFILVFFVMLFVVGIPVFLLELAIGQFSALGPIDVFHRIAPLFQGIGPASVLVSAFIAFYYNMIIGYCIYYAYMSMRKTLPWSTCSNEWNTTIQSLLARNTFSWLMRKPFSGIDLEEVALFSRKVLSISTGVYDIGELKLHLVLVLLAAWLVVFIVLSKSAKSLGKVSYFTSLFPYIMITMLVVNGSLLSGSGKGVEYYMGSFDVTKLYSPAVWKDATVQIFYALSACIGGLTTISSMNPFRNNILNDAFIIPILTCLMGLYSGFAIFTVLGHMFMSKCANEFKDIVTAGSELAFIVYPEGLGLIEVVPPLWSTLFFIMLILMGFGAEFSYVETVMAMFITIFKANITSLKKIVIRFLVCLLFFLLGLLMTTENGFFVLTLFNEYAAGYTLLIIGFLEVFVLSWVYGVDNLIADIEAMIGEKTPLFRLACKISLKFVCPISILLVTMATIVFGSNELVVNHTRFPRSAHWISYAVSATPAFIIIACGIAQIFIHKFNWKKLLSPDTAYYAHRDKSLMNEKKGHQENPIIVVSNADNNTTNYNYRTDALY